MSNNSTLSILYMTQMHWQLVKVRVMGETYEQNMHGNLFLHIYAQFSSEALLFKQTMARFNHSSHEWEMIRPKFLYF